MNNEKMKKLTNILGQIEKDFKITNLDIKNNKANISFETRR